MITELFSMLSSVDVSNKSNSKKFNLSPSSRKNNIRSISAYSSNSIFYFTVVCSDQTTPEEMAMTCRVLEKSYASFVVSCINLMPFHRIKADDKAAIEDYLNQFHQNLGISANNTTVMSSLIDAREQMMGESAVSAEDMKAVQDFLLECWEKSRHSCTDYIKIVRETVDIQDMYNIDAVDPLTKTLQEQYHRRMEELDTWGFLGEATANMLDNDSEDLTRMSDEAILESYYNDDDDDDEEDYFEDEDYDEEDDFDDEDEEYDDLDQYLDDSAHRRPAPMTEGNVKGAVDSIMFELESVSENKILSCSSLGKLQKLEDKLNKLKNRYARYLTRYKRKYNENKKEGTRKKLQISFNGAKISNPKAFMKQYGSYIKIINKRLKLIEKRRAELRKRKGLPPKGKEDDEVKLESALMTLTDHDFDVIDHCIQKIDEALEAPDDEIFTILEVGARRGRNNTPPPSPDLTDVQKKEIDAGNISHETFRSGKVFTDMDLKKANEVVPTYVKATVGFIVDETKEVINRDVLVGIKAYLHKVPALEMINSIYNTIINKRPFLKFVKFISGEEKSLADLLFGFRELRTDALDSRQGAGKWTSAFKQRRRWSKMSVPYLMKNYTPNGTFVITMNEVDFIKSEYGVDILKPEHVKMVMEANFLLGFVVLDQSNEMMYISYDGQNGMLQQYTYAMLQRDTSSSPDRMFRELYRTVSR